MNLAERIKKQERPFLIAGPCSVESESQMLKTAKELEQENKPSLLRGGIWKPRTRPNSFEGVGEIGLPWLVKAGKEINVPVGTEVANSQHVEAALKIGVNVLWIGARTTVNPFSVQEIAEALRGTAVPVMIKNPVNPDLNLWIGAIERFSKVGLNDIVAIHRGFSIYNHPRYRNVPNWEIPIALLERLPEIPLICDPSHISGKRNGLLEVAQQAMDLNFDGLMIETHHFPDGALSDAQQQITPRKLKELMEKIILRSSSMEKTIPGIVEVLRKDLMQIDDSILELLTTRMKIAEEIGKYKKEKGITILQAKHWKKIIEKRLSQADELELSGEFIRQFLDAVHQESIRHQTKVMNQYFTKENL